MMNHDDDATTFLRMDDDGGTLAELSSTLTHPVRRATCLLLAERQETNDESRGLTFSSIATRLGVRGSDLAHHVKILVATRLIEKTERGTYQLSNKGRFLLPLIRPSPFLVDFIRWLDQHPHAVISPEVAALLWHDADHHQLITSAFVFHEVYSKLLQHATSSVRMFLPSPIWEHDFVLSSTLQSLARSVTIHAIIPGTRERQVLGVPFDLIIVEEALLRRVHPQVGSFIIVDESHAHLFFHDRHGRLIPTGAIESFSRQLLHHYCRVFDDLARLGL